MVQAELVTDGQREAVSHHLEEMSSNPAVNGVVLQLRGVMDHAMENLSDLTRDYRESVASAMETVAQAADDLMNRLVWEPAEWFADFIGDFISRFLDWFYMPHLPSYMCAVLT